MLDEREMAFRISTNRLFEQIAISTNSPNHYTLLDNVTEKNQSFQEANDTSIRMDASLRDRSSDDIVLLRVIHLPVTQFSPWSLVL